MLRILIIVLGRVSCGLCMLALLWLWLWPWPWLWLLVLLVSMQLSAPPRYEVVSLMRDFFHLLLHKFSPPFSHPQSPPSHSPHSWAAVLTLALNILLLSSPLSLPYDKAWPGSQILVSPCSGFTQYIYTLH